MTKRSLKMCIKNENEKSLKNVYVQMTLRKVLKCVFTNDNENSLKVCSHK